MRAIKLCNNKVKVKEPFKGLFTQGMVCHETYKNEKGKWLSPDQIEKTKEGFTSKIDGSKIKVGPSEAMSKSKKNIVDPESMIKIYGADAVRWFILSDSPPERDVQWSTEGVSAANKFIQRIWSLNNKIIEKKEEKSDPIDEKKWWLDQRGLMLQHGGLPFFLLVVFAFYRLCLVYCSCVVVAV